jgi:dihydropteroate synthase
MQLMGIVNVTPDSFSDGGRLGEDAVQHGLRLLEEGADWLDIGGESTRPGAAAVPPEEEAARVLPVIHALRRARPDAKLSVDTRRAAVAAEALAAGVQMVNDVSGGADPEMLALVARHQAEIVLMHMRGEPATMMTQTGYGNVVREVWAALLERRDAALQTGIDVSRIYLDPGIGFAKTTPQNLALLHTLPEYAAQHQVLLGASRKAFIGALTGQPVAAERVEGSLAVGLWALTAGVHILRVHDVAATRRALAVWRGIREAPWS